MQSFHELTSREKRIQILRWLCVLPAAALAEFVVHWIVGSVLRVAVSAVPGALGESIVADSFMVLYLAPATAAFVVVGAKVSPRRQFETAIALAVLGILLSLATHVIVQLFGGNRVGFRNYMHFTAEAVGAIGGAAYVFVQARRNRPTGTV
jgi:hypothetical protein